MAAVSMKPPVFWSRLARLRDEWVKGHETEVLWHGDATLSLAIDSLKMGYTKSSAVQIHLFGVAFENVAIVLVADALHVLTSVSTCQCFKPLTAAGAPSVVKLQLIIHTCERFSALLVVRFWKWESVRGHHRAVQNTTTRARA